MTICVMGSTFGTINQSKPLTIKMLFLHKVVLQLFIRVECAGNWCTLWISQSFDALHFVLSVYALICGSQHCTLPISQFLLHRIIYCKYYINISKQILLLLTDSLAVLFLYWHLSCSLDLISIFTPNTKYSKVYNRQCPLTVRYLKKCKFLQDEKFFVLVYLFQSLSEFFVTDIKFYEKCVAALQKY